MSFTCFYETRDATDIKDTFSRAKSKVSLECDHRYLHSRRSCCQRRKLQKILLLLAIWVGLDYKSAQKLENSNSILCYTMFLFFLPTAVFPILLSGLINSNKKMLEMEWMESNESEFSSFVIFGVIISIEVEYPSSKVCPPMRSA